MYIDKNEYTEHIKDYEKKIEIRKILDKIEIVLNKHIVQSTDFLDPYEIYLAKSILNKFEDLDYIVDGGYEDSERNIIIIYPYYLLKEDIGVPISSFKISGDLKDVEHKDYLGSILNLGLKRKKVGDILVYESSGTILVKTEIRDFVVYNLKKVKNKNIEIHNHELDEIKAPKLDYKELNKFLVSLRLDSVISASFNLSRKKSMDIIKSENVKVNFEIIEKPSKEIEEGDMVSVRGFGRFILYEIKGRSKSNRFICIIKIIL